MFRDAIKKLSLRKKLTILASVGVLLPIFVLTYLQYRSLSDLQVKTKGAFKDNVRQGLVAVELKIKQRLEDIAAQTLEPTGNMRLSSASEVEKYRADVKRSHPEIEDIFVFSDLSKQKTGDIYLVSLASRAWMTQSFLDGNRKYFFLHYSSPSPDVAQGTYLFYRLSPNGVAGVLLNERFVKDEFIAGTIQAVGATHTSFMTITVSDENGRVLYSNGSPQNTDLLETNFDRPLSSWKARVGLKNTNLDQLARNGFLHSAGATVLVLLVLLGGIALTVRATDREARLAQAKSDFVANVSHELKTPLSLLSLFSEILELGRVKNEEKKIEYYQIMRHESLRLNKIIDNILDFSKIEAGRKTYKFEEGDVGEVIENVLSSYRYQIVNSGFEVNTNMQPDLPPVLIDRDAMTQAISNLVDNAIKYSRDVKQLSITTKTSATDLSIEMADRGIGIPRAEQAKVFDKFYRVGNGLVHDVKGSGLGLSLVKHIIEAHKGTISVESDVGKGTRFTILLPVAERSAI